MTDMNPPPMVDQKPFLVNAFVEWIIASEQTPYILVDCAHPDVVVPTGSINKKDNTIVLNLSPMSASGLSLSGIAYSFATRFSGKLENIYVPIDAVGAVYSKESGQGSGFEVKIPKGATPELAKGISLASIPSDSGEPQSEEKSSDRKKPALTLV
tara:strand:+ start:2673 stop:3137 length:465 start_codon:yes stop_codon:yes gene_type:complete